MFSFLAQSPTTAPGEAFWLLYEKLRPSLFSGFLTASGFLFAMKTFIIVTMKRDVYDTQQYREMLRDLRTVDSELPHYGPLSNLRDMMFKAILICLATSLLQITLGLVHHWFVALICLLSGCAGILYVIRSVVLVNRNLADWLSREQKKRDEEESISSKGATP